MFDYYHPNNTSGYNHPVNVAQRETTINLSSLPSGLYTVALICDGQIVDAKTLAKQ